MKYFYLLLLVLLGRTFIVAQSSKIMEDENSNYFIAVSGGLQMSGIKSEDFITANYTPLLSLTVGKNLSDLVAVHIGYKGYYFSYIEDSLKHYYTYLFAGLNVNMIKLFFRVPSIGNWSVGVTSGIGYLKNNLPDKHSICANMGLVNSFALSKSFTVTAEISSIIGWDIYQGNWDILPGISLGVAYFFSTSSQ